ncbi:hypothetical protein Acr_00g0004080 [Actinidia rufa]|uniref:Uncharacterized protein n=1 Tax=Actinidia rufa TaxID=165716 RepID=A0A7J0D7P1_9ERIC|nr:hypothetical protein Acr_00g0000120 [Actinidia rufa]GFS28163.1 hypothetical protein Acr_00g0000310 [Actinidia rufa]GFS28820.1 hypothetical protein Acr_00g0004080 [Actinidia rufa]
MEKSGLVLWKHFFGRREDEQLDSLIHGKVGSSTLQVGLAEGERFVKLIHRPTTLTTPATIDATAISHSPSTSCPSSVAQSVHEWETAFIVKWKERGERE